MDFLAKLLQGISFLPAVVHGVEALSGDKSGTEKKDAALSVVASALGMSEAITNKQIVDADEFTNGLGKVIDGVVACLNASTWANAK